MELLGTDATGHVASMPVLVLIALAGLIFMGPVQQPEATRKAREAMVSVLCYHSVEPRPATDLAVTPEMLEQHLRIIRRLELPTLTASEVTDWLQDPRNKGRRAVCLTFDDGYGTVRTRAWPLLKPYGAKATLFIHPRAIGTNGKLSWGHLARWPGKALRCSVMA